MTANVMNVWGEIIGIAVGALILLVFAATTALMARRPRVPPGSRGFRPKDEEVDHEVIAADGYIDSFAGVIEEAGGSLPAVVAVAVVAIPLWWLAYLIINWSPYWITMLTFRIATFRGG